MKPGGSEAAREPPRDGAAEAGGGLEERHGLLLPAALAVVLVAALFLAQRRIDFTVNEEGFLWYGAVAVGHGEVPLRDFYSYDPGRYYWAAAWMALAGQGLDGLRLGTSAFAALGLCCGLLAARRAVRHPAALAALGIVLTLWLLPRNKLYEPAIQMAGILAATALIESPTRRRHLAAGVVTGLGLVLGKNHGLYLGVAFVALIAVLAWRRGLKEWAGRLGAWLGGLVLGASPLLLLAAAAPGFARAYLDSILFFVHQGRTNFPRPVPWPWSFDYRLMDGWAAARTLSIGLCFLLTAALFLGAVLILAMRVAVAVRRGAPAGAVLRRQPLLAAAVVVGAVYTHHAFSRPDLAHLAPSIPALLLLLAALPAAARELVPGDMSESAPAQDLDGPERRPVPGLARARRTRERWPSRWIHPATAAAVVLLLAGITIATAIPAQPLYLERTTRSMVPAVIAGERLQLRPRIAALIGWVERSAAARIPAEAPILLAPNLPGLYPILHRRSPVWDIYPIWPAPGSLDDRMLEELRDRHVDWAVVEDTAVDGRDELRFRHTHPRSWAYLTSNFRLAAALDPAHPWQCALLHRLPPQEGAARELSSAHP